MFYLKYRPQKFSDLIRPNAVADALANQVKHGNVAHAYLFTGARGTGKTTTARILAKAVNCQNLSDNGDPCTTCDSCRAIQNGTFLDLIEIDAASNRSINDIRALQERINLSPAHGKKKVYIIDEVHMLTQEAFNALLKTLEEPPEHAMFILCTTEADKVPATIKSRCQIFSFKRASLDQLVTKLKFVVSQEEATIDDDVLLAIARASLGGYRDAETMLQQVLEGSISVDTLLSLGTPQDYVLFVQLLIDRNFARAVSILEERYASGMDMRVWVQFLLSYLKLLLYLNLSVPEDQLDLSLFEDVSSVQAQARSLNIGILTEILEIFLKAQLDIQSIGGHLPVIVAVARVANLLDPSAPVSPKSVDPKRPKDKTSTPNSKPQSKSSKKTSKQRALSSDGPSEATNHKDPDPTSVIASVEVSKVLSEDISAEPALPLESVSAKWNEVLRTSTKHNHSVRALLKTAKPIQIIGSKILLEVTFAFHKERLEYTKNRVIVENVLQEVFDLPLTFECRVKKVAKHKKFGDSPADLTDLNVTLPDKTDAGLINLDASLLEVFDGGLPL